MAFIGEGQKTASYSYREILEEGLDCNIGERILDKIFPDLDEGLKIDELFWIVTSAAVNSLLVNFQNIKIAC